MSEKLLQAILDELISLNKKIENIEEVVEIISGKMNDTEEQLDNILQTSKELEKSVDGIRSDISELENKVIYNMPSLGTLEYYAADIDFKGIAADLKKIAKNTA